MIAVRRAGRAARARPRRRPRTGRGGRAAARGRRRVARRGRRTSGSRRGRSATARLRAGPRPRSRPVGRGPRRGPRGRCRRCRAVASPPSTRASWPRCQSPCTSAGRLPSGSGLARARRRDARRAPRGGVGRRRAAASDSTRRTARASRSAPPWLSGSALDPGRRECGADERAAPGRGPRQVVVLGVEDLDPGPGGDESGRSPARPSPSPPAAARRGRMPRGRATDGQPGCQRGGVGAGVVHLDDDVAELGDERPGGRGRRG